MFVPLSFLHWHIIILYSALWVCTKAYQAFTKSYWINVDTFTSFVVCPQYHSLYDFDQCLATVGNRKDVKRCQHVSDPDHPQVAYRRRCEQLLLKICKGRMGYIYHPFKVYCCQSTIHTLKHILTHPNFLLSCEKCRNKIIPREMLGDIYDGRVSKQFSEFQGKPFLSDPHSLVFY